MVRLVAAIAVVAIAGAGWYFTTNYTLKTVDNGYLIAPRSAQSSGESSTASPEVPPVARGDREHIRIASFNLGHLDENKLRRVSVAAHLARLLARFDLIALQGIYAPDQGLMLDLIEQVNALGRHYTYALPEYVGRKKTSGYSAFLFDRASIEVDPSTVVEVEDPEGLFWRRPLVGAFRVRGPSPDAAFTFTLVNVHINPNDAVAELELLDEIYRSVRDDGRNEDDIVLLGSLAADNRYVEDALPQTDMSCVIVGVPTTTRGTHLADNLVIRRAATTEFTGRSGVVDLMRAFDLSMQDALGISEHLPIWAEFGIYEGRHAGPVVCRPPNPTR